jgi:hypothetical protein
LLGRKRERAVLNRLLDEVRGGRGHVLVMPGEGGIGKTALLECPAKGASARRRCSNARLRPRTSSGSPRRPTSKGTPHACAAVASLVLADR